MSIEKQEYVISHGSWGDCVCEDCVEKMIDKLTALEIKKKDQDEIRKMSCLETVRVKKKYRKKHNVYINVSSYKGHFIEVFISFEEPNNPDYKYMISGWDFSTRMASINPTLSVDEIIKHAKRSSLEHDDLPGLILIVMEEMREAGLK